MGIQRSSQVVLAFCLAFVANVATATEITLFEGPNFQGRSMTLRGETSNLDGTGFNDREVARLVRTDFRGL
jgi:hypothetical protein